MASTYYGSSGELVRELQKQLNSYGAGLTVDGIWGDKTENAYGQYGTYLSGNAAAPVAISASVAAPDYYTPNVKSDEEIDAYAKGQTDDYYDALINNLENSTNHNIDSIEDAINNLDGLYENRIDELRDTYEYKGQQLSDYALSRGMGRSSYALDMQNRNLQELSKAENQVQSEKMAMVHELNREILTLKMELENSKVLLTAEKQKEYQSLIYQLEKERNGVLWEAQKYNYKLWSDYQDRIMAEKKYQLDVAKYQLSLEKYRNSLGSSSGSSASKSGSSSKSSSSSSSSAVNQQQVVNTWNSLNYSSKMAYFEQNGNTLKQAAPNLYAQMLREYTTLKNNYDKLNHAKNIYNS